MAKELKNICEELKREIKSDLKDFKETIERELRKELREINASLTFLNKMFEDVKDELKQTKAEQRELRAENANLLAQNQELQNQVSNCLSRIVLCEQYSRNANIEIKGVPALPNENLTELLKKLGEVTGETISANDVEICHRVPVAKNPTEKNIVVQFVRRSKRNLVLEKARRLKLTTSDLGLHTRVPLFVNEHLCPELKRLLGQATSKKREFGWKFTWVRNGQIFARKAEDTPVVKISTEKDLSKITAV